MTSALMSSLHEDPPGPITLAQDRSDLEVLPKTGRQVEITRSVADLLIPYLDLLFYDPSDTNYVVT